MVPRLAGFVVALTVVITGGQAGAQTPHAPPDTPVISLPPAFDRVLRDYYFVTEAANAEWQMTLVTSTARHTTPCSRQTDCS